MFVALSLVLFCFQRVSGGRRGKQQRCWEGTQEPWGSGERRRYRRFTLPPWVRERPPAAARQWQPPPPYSPPPPGSTAGPRSPGSGVSRRLGATWAETPAAAFAVPRGTREEPCSAPPPAPGCPAPPPTAPSASPSSPLADRGLSPHPTQATAAGGRATPRGSRAVEWAGPRHIARPARIPAHAPGRRRGAGRPRAPS